MNPHDEAAHEVPWTVRVRTEAVEDLKWFDLATRKLVLESAIERLISDPKSETRNMKTLRPNLAAQRELRLLGRYRILFDIDEETRIVMIKVVGEKRGNLLFVRGHEYKVHHETDFTE